MAALFKPGVLTTDGKALLAKWQAGGTAPQITHAAIGSGSYTKTEDASTRTSLKAEKLRVGISSATADGDTLNLRFVFSNDNVTHQLFRNRGWRLCKGPGQGRGSL